MRGLGAVKASVDSLLSLLATNAELEDEERPIKEVALNRVFLGNPGTGEAGRRALSVDPQPSKSVHPPPSTSP